MSGPHTDLPRILIIDDALEVGSSARRNTLSALAICDYSYNVQVDTVGYLAIADICTGMDQGVFSLERLRHQVTTCSYRKWALVLVDLYFTDTGSGDRPQAQHIINMLRTEFHLDDQIFILFSGSKKDKGALSEIGCSGAIPKPTKGELREGTTTLQRRTFGKLLFEHGFAADGAVRYVNHNGDIVSHGYEDGDLFVGETAPTLRELRNARRALLKWARRRCPILIEGESGNGKTRLGRYLHRWSKAALEYMELGVGDVAKDHRRDFHVVVAGEIGSALLYALLFRGKFPAMVELLGRSSFDTILFREMASFDSGTLVAVLRMYSANPPVLNGLHLFTTSRENEELLDSGWAMPPALRRAIKLRVPRLSLRGDSDEMFVQTLNKKRGEMQLRGESSLSLSAREWLMNAGKGITFRQLEEMAALAAKGQAENGGGIHGAEIERAALMDCYEETRDRYEPKTGLKGMLHRVKAYELAKEDTVENSLIEIKQAIYPLFIQIMQRADTEYETVNSAGLHLGARKVEASQQDQQGNVVRDYLKQWFEFLGVSEDDPSRKKYASRGGVRKKRT